MFRSRAKMPSYALKCSRCHFLNRGLPHFRPQKADTALDHLSSPSCPASTGHLLLLSRAVPEPVEGPTRDYCITSSSLSGSHAPSFASSNTVPLSRLFRLCHCPTGILMTVPPGYMSMVSVNFPSES